uniref:Major capsid protein n=1 Tax=viral metagenome TaxID=1070528 RepID=A0A6C0B1B0_9ZZZZ
MGGGLLQLVAYGAQDAYISGNPQITFWKGLFKRHTNFAMEPFRINFSGQIQWGTKQTALVGRHADLLYSTYVEVVLPRTTQNGDDYFWNNEASSLGYNLIKYVELDIGGQVVDRMYSEFMYLWGTLTQDLTGSLKLASLLSGPCEDGSGPSRLVYAPECGADGRQQKMNVLYIPLPFFFTRNPGAALPLIALQYHEVKINVLWNEAQFIAGNFTKDRKEDTSSVPSTYYPPIQDLPQAIQAALYIDYIYLDTEERRRMAQASHEYLIEQTQFNEEKGITGANNRIDLTFNHPVKELIWVVQPSYYTDCRIAAEAGLSRLRPFSYDNDPVFEQWLQINGQDRMDRRYGDYFNKVQAYQHHSGFFGGASLLSLLTGGGAGGGTSGTGAYMYSFALRPEEHQPSGTCNFSRIDTATIVMNMASLGGSGSSINPGLGDAQNWNVRVYAINYNVLRVMSGMGGLAYSN